MTELYKASRQWAIRPDDERYTTLEGLYEAVHSRRAAAVEIISPTKDLHIRHTSPVDGDLYLNGQTGRRAFFNHWSFGQLCQRAGAPSGYLRGLPALLAENNLLWGLQNPPQSYDEDAKMLILPGEQGEVRAFTSSTYGRIWDEEVVEAVQRINHDGRWQVPSASYAATDPLRATTLYASDRDVFLFMVDPDHPIDGGSKDGPLYRGFMAWNSEVGRTTFGLMTFLYQRVCDNRIVWGASEISRLTIRHTKGGPDRFAQQAVPALRAYSTGSVKTLEEGIAAAKVTSIGQTTIEAEKWLTDKGFTDTAAKLGLKMAEMDGRDPTNLWDAVWGMTRGAQGITPPMSVWRWSARPGAF